MHMYDSNLLNYMTNEKQNYSYLNKIIFERTHIISRLVYNQDPAHYQVKTQTTGF